jgi:hypothetical protein
LNSEGVSGQESFSNRKEVPQRGKTYLFRRDGVDTQDSGGLAGQGRGQGSTLKGDKTAWLATCLAEPGKVRLHLAISGKRREGGIEYGESAGLGGTLDAVVHPLPFPARRNDSGTAEVGKMARDLGLALAQDLNKVTNADFAAVHQVEQAQAGAISQRGE